MDIKMKCRFSLQRGSYKVWGITMGVCPHLEFDDIRLIYCQCMNSIFIVHLIFMQFHSQFIVSCMTSLPHPRAPYYIHFYSNLHIMKLMLKCFME